MTMKNNIQRLETYNSYSGCDMVVTAQLSSYEALKDNVYTLGSLQTISISTHQEKRPVRSLGNINAKEYTMGQRTIAGSLVFAVFDKHFADQIFKDSLEASNIGSSTILLPDELPPIDITISYANEYGHASKMRLYGVRLINEGQVMSVNDIYTENTYQFVATGLEPLSKENLLSSFTQGTALEENIIKNTVSIDNYNDINKILEFPDYTLNFNKKESVNLTIQIEQPITIEDNGIVKFYLTPNQNVGAIKIFPSSNNEAIIYNLETDSDGVYYMMLPIDNYYAYYESDDKLSNTVNFSIYFTKTEVTVNNDIPIIEYATNNSISIISNNKAHNLAVCQEANSTMKDKNTILVEIVSKKATFSNLKSNTSYNIYTTYNTESLHNKSGPATVFTLNHENELLDNFITFVKDNKELLNYGIEDYNDMLIDLDNKNNNIIDSILKYKTNDTHKDMLIKQELLLYAIKFQNIINTCLNKSNQLIPPEKDIKNAFGNTFNISNDVIHTNVYRKERNKNYFDIKVLNNGSYTYQNKSNIKYIANNITNNNIRSCSYEFCCFDYDVINLLSSYADTNKLHSLNNSYNKISSVNALKELCKNHKKPSIPIIQRPMIQIDEDLSIYIDLSYFNQLPLDKDNLRLVISKTEECLDYTPHIKVRLNKTPIQDNIIKIEQRESTILRNKSYALWIEDYDMGQISYCECIDTYFEDVINIESLDINVKELEVELTKIMKHINEHMKISDDMKNSISSVVEYEDLHISNFHDKIIETVIKNKALVVDLAYLLFLIMSSKHKLDPLTIDSSTDKVIYNKKDATLTFETEDYSHFAIININSETGEINKQSFKDNNNGMISLGTDRFAMVYKTTDNGIKRSGFVLIDQASKEALSYKTKVEVI